MQGTEETQMYQTDELRSEIQDRISTGDTEEFVKEFCRTFELIEKMASTVDLSEAYVLLSELAFAAVHKLEEIN